MKKHHTLSLTAAVAVMAQGILYSGTATAAGTLNVYNWGEYIGEETIANFEKEYDIKVTYDLYDSVETADAKLLTGNSGYDVVSHSGTAIGRLIPAGILQPVDKSKLTNYKNLRTDVLGQVAENWDPDNKYVIPYMWGTHGVTYNEELVKALTPTLR